MKKNILAICDRDEGYAKRLMENINARDTFPFEISYFTDVSLFYKKLALRQIELGIINEELYEQKEGADRVIALFSEGKATQNQLPKIWKYQAGEEIRKSILDILARSDTGFELDKESGKLKKTGVISFFSPCISTLSSLLALGMAKSLSKDKKVLYISLEGFSAAYGLMELDKKRDITDLMFYHKNQPKRTVIKLEEIACERYGFDIIPPAKSCKDLYEIGALDWLELIELIEEKTEYDYVILDISEGIDGLFKLLSKSRYVFTPTGTDKCSKEKLDMYRQQLEGEELLNILNKTEFMQEGYVVKEFVIKNRIYTSAQMHAFENKVKKKLSENEAEELTLSQRINQLKDVTSAYNKLQGVKGTYDEREGKGILGRVIYTKMHKEDIDEYNKLLAEIEKKLNGEKIAPGKWKKEMKTLDKKIEELRKEIEDQKMSLVFVDIIENTIKDGPVEFFSQQIKKSKEEVKEAEVARQKEMEEQEEDLSAKKKKDQNLS